jgi:hypothetical protein
MTDLTRPIVEDKRRSDRRQTAPGAGYYGPERRKSDRRATPAARSDYPEERKA